MNVELEQVREKVLHCGYYQEHSSHALRDYLLSIIILLPQKYSSAKNNDSLEGFITQFRDAAQQLDMLQGEPLHNFGGGGYKQQVFCKAKADALYSFSLLKAAIQLGFLKPLLLGKQP